jgi:hypothetical protein
MTTTLLPPRTLRQLMAGDLLAQPDYLNTLHLIQIILDKKNTDSVVKWTAAKILGDRLQEN